jgi:D-alanyl-D-alanine carboxypeptidase
LLVTGSITAATHDASRPARVAVERRIGHSWHVIGAVTLKWVDAKATFAYSLKNTSRPGTYSLRVRLTPKPGTTITRAVSPVVKAAIDLVVSGPLTRKNLPYTYRAGCPVGPTQLRAITMNYWSFNTGSIQRGTLIVRSYTVADVSRVFTLMFKGEFPIHKMYPVDRYQGKDVRAMAHDDTSAFNCRSVTGNPYRTSQHSYGNAIDVNTWENPYVTSGHVYPSHHFLRRTSYHKGMVMTWGVVRRVFAAQGWLWGARWSHPDYQHFSSNGG